MGYGKKILIYAYGNPGRQDDGLGNALIDLAETWVKNNDIEQVSLDSNYQLQVEDVIDMHDKRLIIFVDADMDGSVEDFRIDPVMASSRATFTMHALSPGYLLDLCNRLYGHHPPAYMLHIRGYEWDQGKPMTAGAKRNLDHAWKALLEIICNPELLVSDYFECVKNDRDKEYKRSTVHLSV
ncbi:MAG: hypothetical protein WD097_06130 [Balneolales bacterium]